MPTSLEVALSDDDARQLAEEAKRQSTTVAELAQRWVEERLIHEREKALGISKHLSPHSKAAD